MKKHTASFAIVTISLVGVLAWYGSSIWPSTAASDELIATKPITRQQAVGGVPTTKESSQSKENDDRPPTAPSVEPTPRSLDEAHLAPKQQQVAETITEEYEYRALATSTDPLSSSSWMLATTNAYDAWDTTTGSGSVIAVIDTGFGLAHEDLRAAWHQNSGETGMTSSADRCWTGTPEAKQSNDCDDDANGYVDDYRGWDFVDVNNEPQAGDRNPDGGAVAHGTEVAGLVGAVGNNGIGTATIAWNNQVMPLQALSDDGAGYTSDVVAAIYYAVDNDADVINMSLGGSVNDPAMATATQYAHDNDVVVVAAAGNCGTGTEYGCDSSNPGAMSYPALNRHVISVGATTESRARASFSSYGPGLDVVAPGSGSIVSPMWTKTNGVSAYSSNLYGTSFASPIVASYVGLLKSVRPSSSVNDITALIDATASKPTTMADQFYSPEFGHGLIDINHGLTVATRLEASSSPPTLRQLGGHETEHGFLLSSTLSSGCELTPSQYCTVWAQNESGHDRFLPYRLSNSTGDTSWSWPGTVLGDGAWKLRARSGDHYTSKSYYLLRK